MPANARHRNVSPTAILIAIMLLGGCAPVHHEVARPIRRYRPVEPAAVDRSVDDEHAAASRTYLLLRLRERRLYMVTYDLAATAPEQVESFPVAIGRSEYETPTGVFAVTDKVADPDWIKFDWDDPSRVLGVVPPGPDNPLGRRWIGFASGYGWQIGFHGTPHPELLGQAVSHGCVRMRNDDVVKIYDRVRVGTVVIVQP